MIAVMRPLGEVVIPPFECAHTESELEKLANLLKSLPGESRVVMEATGSYHAPVARFLHDAGFYVCVVNPILLKNYGNNKVRKAKTDKLDAIKIANYGIDRWHELRRFFPEEDTRLMLKTCYRQYQQYSKLNTMLKNNLISMLDTAFPDVNRLFSSPPRADGSEKWVDFVAAFWHCQCVCGLSERAFVTRYRKWCDKHGYYFSQAKALDTILQLKVHFVTVQKMQVLQQFKSVIKVLFDTFSFKKKYEIYSTACGHFSVMPKTDTAKLLVEQAVSQIRATSSALAALRKEMLDLASTLPEFPVVMNMFGVGPTLGPQLMAEIGDIRRFQSKKALVGFAGIDPPPDQSGSFYANSRSISKRGSPSLRRTLFLVMGVYLKRSPADEPVYRFMCKKRAEGKPYKVYMMASANKFLRVYYATVRAYLDKLDQA